LVSALTSLALGLALSSLSLAPGQRDSAAGPESCSDSDRGLPSFGPRSALTTLIAYIDPTQVDQLQIWLEVRRLAGERPGELRLELRVTRGGGFEGDPGSTAELLRLWFMAVSAMGESEAALRLIEYRGWPRVASLLRSSEGHTQLADALGLDPALVTARLQGHSGECLARRLDRDAARMARQTMGQPAVMLGIVDSRGVEIAQYIDPELGELRAQLDRSLKVAPVATPEITLIPFGPSLPAQATRLDRVFPDTGVVVGGAALPHRLVLFVEDEEHGKLPGWLAPSMAYRAQNPGSLSVQVIAAGVGSRAIRMRRRLCAARSEGLEVEFLGYLAQWPATRRLHEAEIDAVLQPIADSDRCSDDEPLTDESTQSGTDFGHPRGAWLDGRPVNQGDLENLEWELKVQPSPSIIDWLIQPANLGESESLGS